MPTTTCHLCGIPVDPIRSPVRVVGAAVVRSCARCVAGQGPRPAADAVPAAPGSAPASPPLAAAAPAGQPIAAAGRRRPRVRPEDGAPRRWRPWLVGGVAIAVVLAGAGALASSLAGDGLDVVSRFGGADAREPRIRLLDEVEITDADLAWLASLPLVEGTDWVHPIAGSEEQLPSAPSRVFRAERPGLRAPECGRGHCGVDLDAPRGSPIVAVRPGVVDKVEGDRGASGGRHVWIRHDDLGLRTEYFHLDEVAPDLAVGLRVVAGQWLGTLGKTGIHNARPHLHFAVRDLRRNERYSNPAPMLAKARIIDVLDLQLPAPPPAEPIAAVPAGADEAERPHRAKRKRRRDEAPDSDVLRPTDDAPTPAEAAPAPADAPAPVAASAPAAVEPHDPAVSRDGE